MDSDAPRSRIDQFFASKKKRTLSPKTLKDSSPSAKGSLESYLVTSQNESVKRNLALDIELSTKNESKETLVPSDDNLERVDRLAPSEVVPSEEPGDKDAGSEAGVLDNLTEDEGPEETKLKQFALDFLSVYCSGIQASSPSKQKLNEHKRCGSPSLPVVEGTSSKRRHHVADEDTPKLDKQTSSSNKRALGPVSCCSNSQKEEKYVSDKVDNDEDLFKQQGSIRKCNKISNSNSLVNECSTPATLCKSASARETPVSTRGNSIFSPGDAFWNEAIQVVDGLFAQTGNKFIQVAEDSGIGKTQNEGASYDYGEGRINDNLNVPVGVDASSSKQTELDITLPEKYGGIREIETSTLPVKHFDFLCDDKILDDNMPTAVCNIIDNKRTLYNNAVLTGSEVKLHALAHKQAAPVSGAEDRDKTISDSPNRDNVNCVASGISDGVETPSSSMPLADRLDLSNWLPPTICNIYRRRGMSKLYPWQVDCLQMDGVLQKRNLVYCASTSAGKSFVAEILMLRRVIDSGKIALLVLPYVSICVEKAEHLEVLLEPLGKHVRSYYGNQGGWTLPKDTSVAVCTIEKANSLVNRLLEEDRLSELGIIVIDELHMVADPSRGYLLELLLTKLCYAAGEGNLESCRGESSATSSGKADITHGLQIVGMSATMPNVAAVADWLHRYTRLNFVLFPWRNS